MYIILKYSFNMHILEIIHIIKRFNMYTMIGYTKLYS